MNVNLQDNMEFGGKRFPVLANYKVYDYACMYLAYQVVRFKEHLYCTVPIYFA